MIHDIWINVVFVVHNRSRELSRADSVTRRCRQPTWCSLFQDADIQWVESQCSVGRRPYAVAYDCDPREIHEIQNIIRCRSFSRCEGQKWKYCVTYCRLVNHLQDIYFLWTFHLALNEIARTNFKLQVWFRVFNDISIGKRCVSGYTQRTATYTFTFELSSGTYRSELHIFQYLYYIQSIITTI